MAEADTGESTAHPKVLMKVVKPVEENLFYHL